MTVSGFVFIATRPGLAEEAEATQRNKTRSRRYFQQTMGEANEGHTRARVWRS